MVKKKGKIYFVNCVCPRARTFESNEPVNVTKKIINQESLPLSLSKGEEKTLVRRKKESFIYNASTVCRKVVVFYVLNRSGLYDVIQTPR